MAPEVPVVIEKASDTWSYIHTGGLALFAGAVLYELRTLRAFIQGVVTELMQRDRHRTGPMVRTADDER